MVRSRPVGSRTTVRKINMVRTNLGGTPSESDDDDSDKESELFIMKRALALQNQQQQDFERKMLARLAADDGPNVSTSMDRYGLADDDLAKSVIARAIQKHCYYRLKRTGARESSAAHTTRMLIWDMLVSSLSNYARLVKQVEFKETFGY